MSAAEMPPREERRPGMGKDPLALVEGRLGFTVRNGKLKMTRTEDVGQSPSV